MQAIEPGDSLPWHSGLTLNPMGGYIGGNIILQICRGYIGDNGRENGNDYIL